MDLPDDPTQLRKILAKEREENHKIKTQIAIMSKLQSQIAFDKNAIRKAHNNLVDDTKEILKAKEEIGSKLAAINDYISSVKPEVSDEQRRKLEQVREMEEEIRAIKERLAKYDDEDTLRRKIQEKQRSIADMKAAELDKAAESNKAAKLADSKASKYDDDDEDDDVSGGHEQLFARFFRQSSENVSSTRSDRSNTSNY